jgi:hypothetical protein
MNSASPEGYRRAVEKRLGQLVLAEHPQGSDKPCLGSITAVRVEDLIFTAPLMNSAGFANCRICHEDVTLITRKQAGLPEFPNTKTGS